MIRSQRKSCSVDGCDRPAHCVGMCGAHWQRYKRGTATSRTGFTDPIEPRRKRSGVGCSVLGCGLPSHSLGLCKKHYSRSRGASGLHQKLEGLQLPPEAYHHFSRMVGELRDASRERTPLMKWARQKEQLLLVRSARPVTPVAAEQFRPTESLEMAGKRMQEKLRNVRKRDNADPVIKWAKSKAWSLSRMGCHGQESG